MELFYITFSQKSALRNFYVEIMAPFKEMAVALATLEFKYVAFIYDSVGFTEKDKAFFPEGCLCRIKYNPANDKSIAESIYERSVQDGN